MSHVVSKRKIIGALLAFVPIPFLVMVLAGYAIFNFVVNQIAATGAMPLSGFASSGRFVLGMMGLVAVISVILIPVGIYLLVKRDPNFVRVLRRQSLYESMSEEHLTFVTHASLGAFLNPFVWALGNQLYWWAMGMLVPFWGIYVWARLVVDGRRLSFEKGWSSFAHFERSQKSLLQVIGLLFLLQFVLPILIMMFSAMIPALFFSGAKNSVVTNSSSSTTSLSASSARSCALRADTDRDLIADFDEQFSFHTDPKKSDTDGDGFDDFSEILHAYDAGSVDDKVLTDTDNDGLSDATEKKIFASDYKKDDTDADGVSDGDEVKNGVSPSATGETLEAVTAARQADLTAYDQECAQ